MAAGVCAETSFAAAALNRARVASPRRREKGIAQGERSAQEARRGDGGRQERRERRRREGREGGENVEERRKKGGREEVSE